MEREENDSKEYFRMLWNRNEIPNDRINILIKLTFSNMLLKSFFKYKSISIKKSKSWEQVSHTFSVCFTVTITCTTIQVLGHIQNSHYNERQVRD